MGLFSRYKKCTPLYGTAIWVGEQFIKLRRMDPDISERDIANVIFFNRYERQNPRFNRKEHAKYSAYASSREELINSLLDLCYVMLDIESDVNPLDGSVFPEMTAYCQSELRKFGIISDEGTTGRYIDNWVRHIGPSR